MATPDDFRRIALSFAGAEERAHMAHPDFRVGGKIFASLGSPDADWAMVGLLPEQQLLAVDAEPDSFRPAAGAWGRGGSTLVKLDAVSDDWLERALSWAWQKRAPASIRPKARSDGPT
jgi:hypothetical protein